MGKIEDFAREVGKDIKALKDNQIETDDLSVMIETATAKSYLQAKEDSEQLAEAIQKQIDNLKSLQESLKKSIPYGFTNSTGGKNTTPNATNAGRDGAGNIQNMNLIERNGYFYCSSSAVGNPVGAWGTVFHYNPDGGVTSRKEAIQLYYSNTGTMALRHHRNSSIVDDWEPWKTLATLNDLSALEKRIAALEAKVK